MKATYLKSTLEKFLCILTVGKYFCLNWLGFAKSWLLRDEKGKYYWEVTICAESLMVYILHIP